MAKTDSRVRMVLDNLDEHANYGGVFHETSGKSDPLFGRTLCRLCAACVKHTRAGDFCRHNAISGVYQAMISGQIHRSTCWLGLDNLIAPVCPEGKEIIGALEVGGLLPVGKLQEVQHNIFATLAAVEEQENLIGFMNALQGLEEMPAVNVENLKAFLREAMFSSGLLEPRKFESNHAIWSQQLRLSRLTGNYESLSQSERRRRLLEAAVELVESLNRGAEEKIMLNIDTILGIASASGTEDLGAAKSQLLPILSLLILDRVPSGEKWSKALMELNMRMDEMSDIPDFKDLCYWFESAVLEMPRPDEHGTKGQESFSARVLEYLHAHLAEDIRLSQISKPLGASPSSIMHKLKEETGRTFSQHLNAIRVKEAKRLLTFTSLPLGEISTRCGFKDQSYFTKVFTKHINIRPREFRGMLKV